MGSHRGPSEGALAPSLLVEIKMGDKSGKQGRLLPIMDSLDYLEQFQMTLKNSPSETTGISQAEYRQGLAD